MIKNYFIDYPTEYDLSYLKSGWAKKNFNIEADSILAFLGPLKGNAKSSIPATQLAYFSEAEKVLHLVTEHRRLSKREMILRRHIFLEIISKSIGNESSIVDNNIVVFNQQLSISHLASNLRASMFHIAILISNDDNCSDFLSLSQLDLNPKHFAIAVMQKYCTAINTLCTQSE